MSSVLPSELWDTIFRSTGYGPASPPLHNIHLHYHRQDPEQRRNRGAIVTKARIAQVCKGWQEIVEPALFEHLVVARSTSLDTLIQSLRTMTRSRRTRGELAKRLDIVLERNDQGLRTGIQPNSNSFAHIFSQLGELLSLVPNIKLLLVGNSFPDWEHVKHAIEENNFLSSVTAALEKFFWIEDGWRQWPRFLRIPEGIWTAFLGSHPQLKLIQSPPVNIPREIYWDEPTTGLLVRPMSHVTNIASPTAIHDPDLYLMATSNGQDSFPNLRHVTFRIPYIGPMTLEMIGGTPAVPTFLEKHGSKITSMDCVYEHTLSDWSPQLQYFPMIAKLCPHLEELGLFHNWDHRTQRHEEGSPPRDNAPWSFTLPCEFPGVKKLNVRRMNRHFRVDAYREMLAFVAKTVGGDESELPNCRVVQFVSERDCIYFSKNKRRLASDLGALATLKVDLLDYRGCALEMNM